MSEEATKILHKFQKLKQRNKPLYLKAFNFMNALTQVLQVRIQLFIIHLFSLKKLNQVQQLILHQSVRLSNLTGKSQMKK